METERQTVLSDQDYQELISRRVHAQIRAENIATRRWWIGIGIALIVGIATILVMWTMWYLDLQDLRGEVDQISEIPTVERTASQFSDLDRLEIIGFGFGESFGQVDFFGQVELYYEPRGEFCRSSTVLLNADNQTINAWADERIIARPTDEQKQEIISTLFANCSEPPFDQTQPVSSAITNSEILGAVVPYIRVVTVDGRRSLVW